MSLESVCKYNKTGFCRYKKNCRNNHVDEICLEENYCKTKGCIKDILNYAERFQKRNFANIEMIVHTNTNNKQN